MLTTIASQNPKTNVGETRPGRRARDGSGGHQSVGGISSIETEIAGVSGKESRATREEEKKR